jgi:hypothetical protein
MIRDRMPLTRLPYPVDGAGLSQAVGGAPTEHREEREI